MLKKLLIAFLFLRFVPISVQSKVPPSHGGDEGIGGIIHKLQNFFTFLCTRCKEVVQFIDGAIDSQSLKKDANALCEALLGFNEVVLKVCKSVVEDILGEIYTQLKKFEPDHSACTHLHLCDACILPQLTTDAPLVSTKHPKIREDQEIDTSKLLHGIAKLHHLAFSLSHNHTDFLFLYQ